MLLYHQHWHISLVFYALYLAQTSTCLALTMDNLTHENKLRVTVHSEVRKICREVGEQINMEVDADGVSLIAEFMWKRLRVIAQDLEQFARHAKRSTINAEDVKLLVRRNAHLKERISEMAESAAKKKRQMKDKDREQEDT